MKRKMVSYILITVAAIGLTSWKLASNKREMDEKAERSFEINPTVPVRADSVKYVGIGKDFSVSGVITPCNEVTLFSKAQGVVLKKYRKAGDHVSKGTPIAQIENAVIRQTLGLAELNLANSEKDVKRYKTLAESEAVTAREYEAILITHREAQRVVAELREQLSNTTLVSPVSGIMEKDYFEEGTLLTLGAQVADFIDPAQLKAVVSITESEVYNVKKGDKVILTTDVLPAELFDGVVDVVSAKGNGRLSYQVEILLTGKNAGRLKSGMYVSAQMLSGKTSDTRELVISRRAIIESLKNPEVYVVKDNKAYRTKITIGRVFNNYVAVAGGLNPDDMVVVSGQINLVDGRDITLLQ